MINRQLGLSYCGNMEDLYQEILEEFKKESAEQLAQLEAWKQSGQWDRFTTVVHAMKGTSLTIGAEALSESAKGLQFASRDGHYDYVESHFEEFRALLAEVLQEIG